MIEIDKIDFEKLNGIVPAIIVDNSTNQVLMLGFMNKDALIATIEKKKVVFYSRTKERLWMKGETSNNFLNVVSLRADCDYDTLLIHADPEGPTCHKGSYSCFEGTNKDNAFFLNYLYKLVKQRKIDLPENSYTTKLYKEGSNRIIQKFGEESVETIIAAKNQDKNELVNEVSDLLFHLMVLLADNEIDLDEIISNLMERHTHK
ncbi:MAG: bifunctional phosphoribosyl-AMP cyclohydrolase/phosphoribosyl-ATP diphosphatase HisIE [Melioribacteraceae bacterium]|nr:bifunctional phosphoribosyl-AMP cyclohydrolase/phosphoribosyl-ATP diphosphatase HisIE [Melioribacteraceae bacterium]